MKIVIVAQNCFPSIGPRAHRTTELAKELARRGHDVIIYALLGDYNYNSINRQTGITFKNIGNSMYGLVDNTGSFNRNFLFRVIEKFFGKFFEFPAIELIPMVKKSLENEGEIDLLITIAVPHSIHWSAASYIKKNKKKVKLWIADCGDPYMKDPFSSRPFYFKYLEKKWGSLCDFISVPIPDASKAYYSEFKNKIRVIPQGFNFEGIKLSEYKKNSIPTFSYSGFLYKGKRDITNFLEFLTRLKMDFKFIVYTESSIFLMPYIHILKKKLEIRSYVPREELLFNLSKMDFLINIRNDSSVQIPSKLIDYAITGRPILEISSDFKEEKEFEEFMMGNYYNQKQVKNLQQYNIRNVANSFLKLTGDSIDPTIQDI
jgi:glycosyltransferase involved in cell wall biosynthesis